MTTTRRTLLIAGTAALAAPSIRTAYGQGRVTLRLGHLANEQNVWHRASLHLAEQARALSNGRIEVQVFPNETLGREMDVINGMQLGTADMTITGESLQNWAPLASLLAVPYAITSIEQMDVIAAGPIGQQINAEIIGRARVRPLGYFARGPRNLTSNRPVRTPDELNGLRLRVPNVPLFVAVWQALGARPTPMAFGEVFTSLQNGTIDGQENPLALIRSANFNEVQRVLNRTEHVRSWIYVAISERRWQQLSPADREIVAEATRRAQAFERTLFMEDERTLEADLKGKGMTFVDSDQAAFAARARPAALAAVRPEARPLLEQIISIRA
ncbi:TRAP transporter substrate-binding protein [Elioraea sp.]|uniref:TRAP transporter substrate-binding protein n=1 Tax=Elioraea sp. TaxID=2185103 RepID=UPI0025B89155|nr:TRAP transporter substrate-binding protein [Elioraea sp.]